MSQQRRSTKKKEKHSVTCSPIIDQYGMALANLFRLFLKKRTDSQRDCQEILMTSFRQRL